MTITQKEKEDYGLKGRLIISVTVPMHIGSPSKLTTAR